jgi:hypothetical protein
MRVSIVVVIFVSLPRQNPLALGRPIHLAVWPRSVLDGNPKQQLLRFASSRSARRSTGTVAAHKHPIQTAMLAVIVIEAGLMQGGAIVDDQEVALLILVRVTKLRLRDLICQVLQKILGFFG